MKNIALTIICAISAIMFSKFSYQEYKENHRDGAVLMGAITIISIADIIFKEII